MIPRGTDPDPDLQQCLPRKRSAYTVDIQCTVPYLGGHSCQMKDGLSAPICRLHIEAGGHELLHGLDMAVKGGGVGGRVAGRVARPHIGPQLQQGRHYGETPCNRRCVDRRRIYMNVEIG